MKKILLTIGLLLVATLMCAAQKVQMPKQCKVGLPTELNAILIKETATKKLMTSLQKAGTYTQTSRVNKFWIAYSDRENNTTYVSPGTPQKFSALEWNEEVRIAMIQNGYALVYTEPKPEIEYPMISSSAVCRGWVPVSKLLLWQSCLTNDQGIYNKALLCVNLDAAKSSKEYGRGYYAPTTTSSTEQLSTDMDFYFIMKRENNMVLLARQSKMDGAYSNQMLFCWVPASSYVPWNQRSCVEPTWMHEDAEYFADQNIDINIYKSPKLAASGNRVSHLTFERKTSTRYSEYLYRMRGDQLRYPILDDGSSSVYSISTFASPTGKALNDDSPETKRDSITERVLKKMLNINLAIVIDGTQSMKPYYAAVKEAIQQGCEYFQKNREIKVGIVIYRDYTDGNGLAEVLPFTSVRNIERINEFLDKGGAYGIRSSWADRTKTEALYYGINTALDQLRFRDGESNMMLVVGDCGNAADDDKVQKSDLIAKLIKHKISLMGFQVQNKRDDAYDAFNSQMLEMIRTSLLQQYRKLNAAIRLDVQSQSDSYDFKALVDNNFYFGSYRCAEVAINDGVMEPTKLTSLMSEEIQKFSDAVQTRIDVVIAGSKGFRGGKVIPGLINVDSAYLKETMGADWEELIGKGQVVNFRGYTPKKDPSGRDYFKSVIFISNEEFQELLKRLMPVYEAAMRGNYRDRKPYIEALKELVRSFSPGITDDDLGNLSNGDITQMIGGLNEKAEALQSYTLEELSSEQVVPIPKYQRIVNDFKDKYENLRSIKNSKTYKYVKEFNGAKYYWIPIEQLP